MTKLLEFKNAKVLEIGRSLVNFSLVGKASRGRSKLIERLDKKQKEYVNDSKTIQKKYFKANKKGDLLVKDGKYIFKNVVDKPAFDKEVEDLNDEVIGIEFVEYSEKIEALKKALDNYPEKLSGSDAEAYDLLMDQLEKNFNKGEDK
ncbi:DUF1617 family protein [Liquorilactobacillus nagelii]|jgi:hypothetical protein|uniref:DUF1617 family protein n=1 Tax=Liquorilactobacillus nagelii TaxID=82688 RepID=UPI0024328E5A|nr:DUF1617 family protein [Liquorilactobacillus nagelii]MCI1699984.1 DUF1617 family protein [Liquorilactobacillus nagelii]